ncbi:hypothetical protein Vadar_028176 [Vaccinium darrowii]|uniref:Uncharacterized protein n=1 Tax=Vaccinium darrowii TaxID=229202 RepID=A0ACB7YQ14_9ERIC|nr:hypothetical protein Vadar_028176 [Vaccinium darrowii]
MPSISVMEPWGSSIVFVFSTGGDRSEKVKVKSEKQALLSFKKGLEDPSTRLSYWDVEADCCMWARAKNQPYVKHTLGGEVNPSFLNLKHLSYLDLSRNDFGGIPIPSFLGSLTNLRYLNLSEARFGGTVPSQLGNLSSLRSLGLEGYSRYGDVRLDVENLDWLSRLQLWNALTSAK